MANTKSAKKRVRSAASKRLRNRYKLVATRRAIKKLLTTHNKAEATTLLPQVVSLIDKIAKTNVIHKNKAANQKSRMAKHVNALA